MNDFDTLIELMSMEELETMLKRLEKKVVVFKSERYVSVYAKIVLEISNRKQIETLNIEDKKNLLIDFNEFDFSNNSN